MSPHPSFAETARDLACNVVIVSLMLAITMLVIVIAAGKDVCGAARAYWAKRVHKAQEESAGPTTQAPQKTIKQLPTKPVKQISDSMNLVLKDACVVSGANAARSRNVSGVIKGPAFERVVMKHWRPVSKARRVVRAAVSVRDVLMGPIGRSRRRRKPAQNK